MRLVRLSFVAATFALCACASVQMAKPDRDLAAKQFEAPPDQALLYVYRDETFGAAMKLTVLVDGQHVGDTAAHTFLLVPVAEGRHQVVSKAENDATVEFTAQNGKSYFVWQEVKFGVFSARSALHLISEQQGKAAVATCSLVEPPPGLKYPLRSLDPSPAQPQVAAATAVSSAAASTDAPVAAPVVPASTTEGFPRVLSGAEIAAHFARHSSVDATLGRQTFTLTVQPDKSVQRFCPGCRVTYGAGDARVDADRICFQWARVTFPDSGCYQLVQTAADQFTLRGVDQQRAISYSARD